MIARGEVALVMATLGLNNGLLNETTFTVVVLMTVVTTLLTPLLLKLTTRRTADGLHAPSLAPQPPVALAAAIEVDGTWPEK
jgi:Kef-type K+ transport system membrane component KefB